MPSAPGCRSTAGLSALQNHTSCQQGHGPALWGNCSTAPVFLLSEQAVCRQHGPQLCRCLAHPRHPVSSPTALLQPSRGITNPESGLCSLKRTRGTGCFHRGFVWDFSGFGVVVCFPPHRCADSPEIVKEPSNTCRKSCA